MLLLAFLIGIVAGLRAMTAPAAAAWAAHLGYLGDGEWLAFMGWRWTPWVFSVLALGELVTDKLPSTPSRKVPVQFGTRILMGGLAGATFGGPLGGLLGIVGAVAGTYAGAAVRSRLAAAFGSDRPAALIEDLVAVIGAVLIVVAAR